MTQHTPGPWTSTGDPAGKVIVCAAEKRIANVTAHPEKWANARLIAAAPDLLAEAELSCKEMWRVADQIGARGLVDLADDLRLRANEMLMAVTKAKAESRS